MKTIDYFYQNFNAYKFIEKLKKEFKPWNKNSKDIAGNNLFDFIDEIKEECVDDYSESEKLYDLNSNFDYLILELLESGEFFRNLSDHFSINEYYVFLEEDDPPIFVRPRVQAYEIYCKKHNLIILISFQMDPRNPGNDSYDLLKISKQTIPPEKSLNLLEDQIKVRNEYIREKVNQKWVVADPFLQENDVRKSRLDEVQGGIIRLAGSRKGTVTSTDGDKYVGQFKNNQRNGKGTLTFANGDKYVGQFKNNEYSGKGTYTYSNGEQYVGEWKDDLKNGKGILTKGGKRFWQIEEGIFKKGYLIEGSDTTSESNYIRKEVGKWRFDEEKDICEVGISGKGEELYYRTEKDLRNNNYFGYVKGTFDDGTLLEGEVENPSLIEYSDREGIKKIIYEGYSSWSKNVHGERTHLKKGEIHYDDGFIYKGEMDYDLPHGRGTGKELNDKSITCNWFNGNLDEHNEHLSDNNYTLTKTKINSGLRCQKKLWYDFYPPAKQKDEYAVRAGNRFGEVIKNIYGKGLDLSEVKDISDAIQKTKEALNSKDVNIIYEAAFMHEDILVRTDVLKRTRNGWELLEAKASGEKKKQHIPDIAIQYFVVNSCGVNLASVKIILINSEFIYLGHEDYKDLVNEVQIDNEELELEAKKIFADIDELKKMGELSTPIPVVAMEEEKCNKPYKCEYKSRCITLLPRSDLASYKIIPYLSKELREYCEEKNIVDLQDVPLKYLNVKRKGYAINFQKIIQDAHKDNKKWVNSNLKDSLAFDFPVYFLDFETAQQTKPIIIGTKPFEKLPFQWSLHKWEGFEKDISSIEGDFFLDFSSQDIERKFTESLLKAIGAKGTIFAHNAGYEKAILKGLMEKEYLKDLKNGMDSVIKRIKDTLEITRENFYDPKMNGSWSLKDIVKAVPDSVGYNELDVINDGNGAQLAWFICTEKNTNKVEIKRQSTLLKEYCSKDTLNLYYLLKYLIDLSGMKKTINLSDGYKQLKQ